MGTLHPLIIHLPIGILLLNALLVVLSKRAKYAHLSASIPLILLLGAISSVAACVTGWFLSQNGGYTEGVSIANKLPNNIQEAQIYTDIIAPILKAKCLSCHNATKQKGKLNMEDKAAFLKGGEHGAIVVAGQANNSELIKRLLLDINDEHHMSPKGKPQPTEQEITLLRWWINKSLDFDKKVKEIEQTDAIKTVFAQFSQSNDNTLFSIQSVILSQVGHQTQRFLKRQNDSISDLLCRISACAEIRHNKSEIESFSYISE